MTVTNTKNDTHGNAVNGSTISVHDVKIIGFETKGKTRYPQHHHQAPC